MTSSLTGKKLNLNFDKNESFGIVFFQVLKHMVADKYQRRNYGPIKIETRQPTKGKQSMGGVRFGEMERDNGITHGASSWLKERLLNVSDKYEVIVCESCGDFAIDNIEKKQYECPQKDKCHNPKFGRIVIPFVFKTLIYLLSPVGIKMKLKVQKIFEKGQEIIKNIERDDEQENDLNLEEDEEDEENEESDDSDNEEYHNDNDNDENYESDLDE